MASMSVPQSILNGVKTIRKHGVPGTLVVHGSQALPLLKSDEDPASVLMAVSQYGKGKVAVIAHDAYFNDYSDGNQHLYNNTIKWMLGDEGSIDDAESKVTTLTTEDDLKDASVVLARQDIEHNLVEPLERYILNGGCFISACTPWGWMQITDNESVKDMNIYSLLEKTGISFTDDYIEGNIIEVTQDDQDESHFHKAMLSLSADCINWEKYASVLSAGIKHVGLSLKAQEQHNELALQLTTRVKERCYIPKDNCPVSDAGGVAVLKLLNIIYDSGICAPCVAPGAEHFPGLTDVNAAKVTAKIQIESDGRDFYPTGYYLPPGTTAVIKVISDNPMQKHQKWVLRIGAHSDSLMSCKSLKRWPDISKRIQLLDEVRVWSAFGGLVYLESPKQSSKIEIELEGVVKAQHFNLSHHSEEDWALARQNQSAPWVDMVGKYAMITLPASSVKDVSDPTPVLEFWDQVVCAHHSLRGTKPEDHRKQWIVTDVQPVVGYMHSGYPVVTHMDIAEPARTNTLDPFLFDIGRLQHHGCWGLFHEIGHNMQRSAWTFDGTVEVTCNIFTLHALDVVTGNRVWIHKRLKNTLDTVTEYIANGASFQQWKDDPFLALCVYAQLAHHFGWASFRDVFKKYEDEGEDLPELSDQEKRDMWVKKFSETVEHNLMPLFELWGIPVSSSVHTELCALKPFLPSDEMTSLNSERYKTVTERYSIYNHAE